MDAAPALITLGTLFLVGLAADLLARRTLLPRVTLLVLVGIAAGPSGFDLIPEMGSGWYPVVADMALVMVGFLLGGEITRATLQRHGRTVLVVSIAVVLGSAVAVGGGLLLLGFPWQVALLLAAIGTSTDPAAVSEVVREARAEGAFSRTLLGVVAVDDAWGLITFSLLLALALGAGEPGAAGKVAWLGVRDLGGAIGVGICLGLPMAALTGRIRPGEPTLAEALGGVLLCGGIALWLDVSFLLASMTMGVVVANLAAHHSRPFRAIEGIEWPFMILFFVLSGASLRIDGIREMGVLAAAYVGLRVLGRLIGGAAGAQLCDSDSATRRWMGAALLPQAGVALGMALVASQRLPEFGATLLTTVVATTVLFELVGPIATRRALGAAGEIPSLAPDEAQSTADQ